MSCTYVACCCKGAICCPLAACALCVQHTARTPQIIPHMHAADVLTLPHLLVSSEQVLACPAASCLDRGCPAASFRTAGISMCDIDTVDAPIGTTYSVTFLVFDDGVPALTGSVTRLVTVVSPCAEGQHQCGDGVCYNVSMLAAWLAAVSMWLVLRASSCYLPKLASRMTQLISGCRLWVSLCAHSGETGLLMTSQLSCTWSSAETRGYNSPPA